MSILPGEGQRDRARSKVVDYSQSMANARIFRSTSMSEVRENIANTYCPHNLQIGEKGATLDAWLNHRRLTSIGIGVMGYGALVEIEKIQDEDMLLLMQPLHGHADIGTRRQTVASATDLASVVDTGNLHRMRWSGDCVQRVVQIPNSILDQHAMMLMGRPLSQRLVFDEGMQLSPDRASCWSYASLILQELSAKAPDPSGVVLKNLEALFIFKLLESHRNNYSDQLGPQPCKIAPSHVRRTEQFIIDKAQEPILIEDLIEVAGVSARALFDGFRRFRGTSPMAFLKSVRLERVHEDLKNARHGENVTEIACRWHFYQLGRFSAQYRQIFGELPSETLRKYN